VEFTNQTLGVDVGAISRWSPFVNGRPARHKFLEFPPIGSSQKARDWLPHTQLSDEEL